MGIGWEGRVVNIGVGEWGGQTIRRKVGSRMYGTTQENIANIV